jgi:predicted PhzF superfamily epimerase YddE/YHI9
MPYGLNAALGAEPTFVGRCQGDLVVVLDSADTVRNLSPNFAALLNFAPRLVTVTAKACDSEFDFISRCFGPAVGIDEDPVTGSAHCGLGPFWAKRLGKDRLLAYQASKRGGAVEVDCRGERVALRGQAVTVMRGQLFV